jgi:hypothetical protein
VTSVPPAQPEDEDSQSPIQSAGTVGAPLLAGISFALVALVIQSPTSAIRWPDTDQLLFVAAGLLFMVAVQAAMWDVQYRHSSTLWASTTRWSYDIGMLSLLSAIAVMLVPPGHLPPTRGASVALVSVGFIIEVWWIGLAVRRQIGARR